MMSEDEDTAILLPAGSDSSRTASGAAVDGDAATPATHCGDNDKAGAKRGGGQKGNRLVLVASCMAAVGGVLFGYDIGIVSGAVLQLKDDLGLTCLQREMVVSVMLVGALAASVFGGVIVDRIGRRWSIVGTAATFLAGSLSLAVAPTYSWVLGGRALVGFAASLSAVAECVYISEVAPAATRGALVSLNELAITLGFLLAYVADYALVGVHNGWRIMFGIGAAPALLQGIAMLMLPNSPHFLMLRKREAEAESVLRRLRGVEKGEEGNQDEDQGNVKQEMANVRLALSAEQDQNCCTVCSPLDNMQGRLLIGMGLVFFQQITGQPNILYYAPEIFQLVGFCGGAASTLASVGLGIIKFASTCVSVAMIDKVGRRSALLAGTIGMMASIVLLGLVATLQQTSGAVSGSRETCSDQGSNQTISISSTTTSLPNFEFLAPAPVQAEEVDGQIISGPVFPTTFTTAFPMLPTPIAETDVMYRPGCGSSARGISQVLKYIALLSLMSYVACFAFSFGPVTWLVLSEIFPTAVKGRAIALATALNWAANLLVSGTFLQFVDAVGLGGTFLTYGVLCLIATVFIFLVVPETRGKTLSQVSQELRTVSLSSRAERNLNSLPCLRGRRWCQHVSGRYRHVQVNDPDCTGLETTTVI